MKPEPLLFSLTARLRFAMVGAGWPGIVGFVLLAAAAFGQFVLVAQEQAAAAAAKAQAERDQAAYASAAGGGQHGKVDAGEALARFRDLLKSEKQADELMETIQRDAQKNGLAPAGIEYKWQRQPELKLAEVRIVMPLKGGYAPLRAFLKEVLADVPGLALEQCDLQRDNIGSANVDARVRFSLFLKVGT